MGHQRLEQTVMRLGDLVHGVIISVLFFQVTIVALGSEQLSSGSGGNVQKINGWCDKPGTGLRP
jgi:hypothetical protein